MSVRRPPAAGSTSSPLSNKRSEITVVSAIVVPSRMSPGPRHPVSRVVHSDGIMYLSARLQLDEAVRGSRQYTPVLEQPLKGHAARGWTTAIGHYGELHHEYAIPAALISRARLPGFSSLPMPRRMTLHIT